MEAILLAVLEAFGELFFGVIAHIVLSPLVLLIALPLSCLLCTPVVLVSACFGPGLEFTRKSGQQGEELRFVN
jgi:hypothetical protein